MCGRWGSGGGLQCGRWVLTVQNLRAVCAYVASQLLLDLRLCSCQPVTVVCQWNLPELCCAQGSVCPAVVLLLCAITDSLLGDGCRVEYGSVVKNSVLGSCAFIDKHCYIQVGRVHGWGFAIGLDAVCVAGEG